MNPYYTDYSEYLNRIFPGIKVQKISVNTGRGCPNRDGTIGTGGCIYCDNSSFTPAYCFGIRGVAEQLEAGKAFFGRKYPAMQYLAYFQSFTGTYGKDESELRRDMETAANVDGVVGIVIGTRPDCLDDSVLGVLSDMSRRMPVLVELGIETLHDETLRLINRGHDAATALEGIRRAAQCTGHVGVHLIAGLPGENEEDILDTLRQICAEPVDSIKLHHLQVLRNTTMARMIADGRMQVHVYEMEEYMELCRKVISIVPRRIAIERFLASAPPGMVLMPRWGIKNYLFVNKLHALLAKTQQSV